MKPENPPEPEIKYIQVERECPKVEPVTKTEIITKVTEKERIIEKETIRYPKHSLRFVGGIRLEDLRSTKKTRQLNEETQKEETQITLPAESDLLYGGGYDKYFGPVFFGATYLRNKARTMEIGFVNVGITW